MAERIQAIPQGFHSITPSLMIDGASRAIDFYKKAFGAEELSRFPGPDGRLLHATIRIGNSIVMLGDEMPDTGGHQGGKGPNSLGGTSVGLFFYTEDVDAAWKLAIDAGGKTIMPLVDQFWGDRAGCLEDPFGHRWWLAQHIKDLSKEELKKAAEKAFAQPAGR